MSKVLEKPEKNPFEQAQQVPIVGSMWQME
jgi:hypothetical protein